jgi:cytochrome d ubiquinol oxidase subunit II
MEDAQVYLFLQNYWWFLGSLLGALLVFLMFVQGGQTMFGCVTTNEDQKTMVVNTLGRKWELTFTTLVTFGGAMFASFPLFYATSFGGAYWVWMAILVCFVVQAVAYEFRRKPKNFLGTKTFDIFLFINGSLGVILIGTAVGTFFTGAEFKLNEYNQVTWQTGARGLEAALNFNNIALGLAIFFLARILGGQYFINTINEQTVIDKSATAIKRNAVLFLVFFLYWLVQLMIRDGYAYNPETMEVFMEKSKYLHNFFQMPIVLAIFLIGVVMVLVGIYLGAFKKAKNAFWWSGPGTVFAVLGVFLIAGYNNTSFYPSAADLQSSLTIRNASSSKFTLTAMSYVSLLIPLVLAYIIWAWRAINKKQISDEELNTEDLKY